MKILIGVLLFWSVASHAEFKETVQGDIIRYERRVPIDFNWCESNLFAEGGGWSCEKGSERNSKDLIGGAIGYVHQDVQFLKTSEHCNTLFTAYPEGYKLQAFDYDHAGSLTKEQSIACLREATSQLPLDAVTTIDRLASEVPVPPAREIAVGKVGSVIDMAMRFTNQWRGDLQIDQGSVQDRGEYAERGGQMTIRNFQGGTDFLVKFDFINGQNPSGTNACSVNIVPNILLNNGSTCGGPQSVSCRGFVGLMVSVGASHEWDGTDQATIPTEDEVRACLNANISVGHVMHATVFRYF